MANIVLTNQNRTVGVPVRYDELQEGEEVVATNAPLGMLFVSYESGTPTLCDYTDLEDDEVANGVPLCLPNIDDYKENRKKELLAQIRQLDTVGGNDAPKGN
jgi:hypothetical protein